MGKRSNFKRKPRDFYPTPYEAVIPLLPHLKDNIAFIEPCAGDGALINHLFESGKARTCLFACDLEPKDDFIIKMNALDFEWKDSQRYDLTIITNPPWDRKILHPMISHFRQIAPTWLLFDADWAHTKQSAEFMPYCHKIVSVGRVKWIPDSKMTGKDNCAWYLFDINEAPTVFYGRK